MRYFRKTLRVELDPSTFQKDEVKEIRVWSWKRMRSQKYCACIIGDKLVISQVGE